MKVLLAPWNRLFTGFILRIYVLDGEPYPGSLKVEISTFKGQDIAITLIQKHSSAVTLTTFNVERSLRMAAIVEIPDEVAERLLSVLSKLSKLSRSRLIPDELAQNPTIEGVERFLSIKKLLD